MPRQKPARMLLSFQDVVSHFSQEEQELLHNWQKDLYANLMKEIHQVLMSLGPVIASTVFSLRLNEKGRFPVDFEEFDRGLNDDYPPKEKTTGIISESIKEEGEVYSSVDEDHEVVAKVFWPVGFHPLTSEPEDAFLNPIDEDGRDGGDRVSAGMAAITSLISSQTKEESAASSEDHLESEIKRSIYNLTEQSGTESMNENEMHRYSLRKHMRIYNSERHFTCTECGKQVNEKSLLESHQRIHPELRPYRCPDCEMIFTGKSSLLAQQKLHMGVKRYHCNACEKSFTQKQHLVTHQKIHTGFRAFHCTVCEKNFTQKVHLLIHQRTHTGERPYHCRECEKSFTQKPHLLKHQRTHTGVRPFHCTMCEKRFTQKCNLQKHLGVHTGVKPFTVLAMKSGLHPRQPLNVTLGSTQSLKPWE
ncbi:zinc finger protein interacting with ribonucleoprotein K-like isoform X2 [Pleurodeles waltl]|uniref:zinc finger protein interacting with ribonucleoprotein K-like isoform X2 n=1 Tax=Pleurodeles waltl TaxID=8319 RepID=UPI0037099E21